MPVRTTVQHAKSPKTVIRKNSSLPHTPSSENTHILQLQNIMGNQALQRLIEPGSSLQSFKRLALFTKPTQSSIPLQRATAMIQRNVEADIGKIPSSFQSNARVCLVHIHADERNAFEAARTIRSEFCGNFVYINNLSGQNRCVNVTGLSGQRRRSCTADPNRIFSTDAVTRANAFSSPCSCPSGLTTAASRELGAFGSRFMAAISQCRQRSLPVVAFHNNRGFSIRAYRRGGSDAWATASVSDIRSQARTSGLTARLAAIEARLPGRRIRNPLIRSQRRPRGMRRAAWRRHPRYARNFFITTRIEDFIRLAEAGKYNVVMQKRNVGAPGRDDGSLSIALGGQRYLNIEIAGKSKNADIIAFNEQMARDALIRMGIARGPCRTARRVRPSPPARSIQPSRITFSENFSTVNRKILISHSSEEIGKKLINRKPTKRFSSDKVDEHETDTLSNIEYQIQSTRPRGQPLAESIRSYFEPRFNYDFGDVRVHTDNDSTQLNKTLKAQAFTIGKDVYFGGGKYKPGTTSGNKLIAHELTHVIQQNSNDKWKKVQNCIQKESRRRRGARRRRSRPRSLLTSPMISQINVNVTTPQYVHIVWAFPGSRTTPLLARRRQWGGGYASALGIPGPFTCSTGAGRCNRDCNNTAVSQRSGTMCTPNNGCWVVNPSWTRRRTGSGLNFFVGFQRRTIGMHSDVIGRRLLTVDGTPHSHGCVRLSNLVARMIYENIWPGVTTICVHGSWRGRTCWRGGREIPRRLPRRRRAPVIYI